MATVQYHHLLSQQKYSQVMSKIRISKQKRYSIPFYRQGKWRRNRGGGGLLKNLGIRGKIRNILFKKCMSGKFFCYMCGNIFCYMSGKIFFSPFFVYVRKKFLVYFRKKVATGGGGGGGGNFNQENFDR